MSKLPKYLSSLFKSEKVQVASEMMKNEANAIRSSGSVSLDYCLGGGIPVGEMVMFWGLPGSGKSLQALKMIAQEQKIYPNKYAIWIDTEYSFSSTRAASLGVDVDRLVVIRSNTFEGAIAPLAKMEAAIAENKDCCAIVLDSVKALTSINEQGQMEEGNVSSAANAYGGIAKSVNPALNILNRLANECQILTILCNHANANMDTMTSKYQPWVLTGGQRLKHLCSTIIFLEKVSRKDSKLVDESRLDAQGNAMQVGSLVRCKVNKTRQTVEGKVAEFYLNMETGELEKKENELGRLALALGVLTKKENGNTVYFGPEERGIKAGSITAFIELLVRDKALYAKVLAEVAAVKVKTDLPSDSAFDIIDIEG